VEQAALVVMTCRPGTTNESVPMDLSRPRDISSTSVIALRKDLTVLFMEKQRCCHDEELHVAERN
jgi:hypothetical protein